ncbi:DUF2259 domain-containing protein [Rhodobacterales bacterium]|nr:DUF2259 domain-containing protein [Rhodobacterales bacterium]
MSQNQLSPDASLPRRVFTAVLALTAFFLAPFLVTDAEAGDLAEVNVLGFSPAGDFFAFEQFGFEDGSGFPYSHIFVIDVLGDSWVAPSPFRLTDGSDPGPPEVADAELAAVRKENLDSASALLQEKRIGESGTMVGFSPRTELSADPHRMRVSARDRGIAPPEVIDLTMNEIPLPSERCNGFGIEDTKGFRLTMLHEGVTRVLNNDASLPESRGCALGYRIERVITYYPQEAPPVFVILVQMAIYGFEGPDHRYLAIAGRL